MATSSSRGAPMTRDERKVIFASSLGTVFEWYDFFVYGTLASFVNKAFFSGLDPTAGVHRDAARVRRRLLRAPVRRARVRPPGRHDRSQVHVPGHDRDHGPVDRGHRPDSRPTRRSASRPPSSSSCCACCKAWRWAVSTEVPPPTWPSIRRRTSAARTPRGSRPPRRWACSCRWSSSWRFKAAVTKEAFEDAVGLVACAVRPVAGPAVHQRVDPAVDERVAGLQEDEGRGQDVQGAADRVVHQVGQPEDRAARAVRPDGRPGRGVVLGPVLRDDLPDHAP